MRASDVYICIVVIGGLVLSFIGIILLYHCTGPTGRARSHLARGGEAWVKGTQQMTISPNYPKCQYINFLIPALNGLQPPQQLDGALVIKGIKGDSGFTATLWCSVGAYYVWMDGNGPYARSGIKPGTPVTFYVGDYVASTTWPDPPPQDCDDTLCQH